MVPIKVSSSHHGGVILHGILAMVRELSVKPLLQRNDQNWLDRFIAKSRSTPHILVVDGDLTGLCRSELRQSRHALTVNVCGT